MGDDGGAERRLAGPHGLQRDVVVAEHGGRLAAAQTVCGAVDVERRAVDVERPTVESDAARLDRLDVAHSHHGIDAPQRVEFGLRHDRAPVHRRIDGRVDTQQATLGLQPVEQIPERYGLVHRRELAGEVGERPLGELPTGLDSRAVQKPGVAGLDPRQPPRRDAVPDQPQARVHRGLARADDHITVPGLPDSRHVVGRHTVDTGGDVVGRRTHRRHDDFHVAGDHAACGHPDLVPAERADPAVAAVLAHRQVGHPAGRQQLLLHHRVEVRAHLSAAGQFVVARIEAAVVDSVAAEIP